MPLEIRPAQTRQGSPVAAPRRPFHLRLPDVFADERAPAAAPNPELPPPRKPAAYDPTARVRSQLKEKRYQDGHQQVTGMIERMREQRRKLFDRLWIASIAVTALSIVILAVELMQGVPTTAPTRTENQSAKRTGSPRHLARTTPSSPARSVSPAAAGDSSTTLPNDVPVTSALYTTEEASPPRGAWLDGLIANPDSDSEPPSSGVQHDDHQSRTP